MITIFINDDDDDDDDADRYGDFSCVCVYKGVYLTHIQKCLNIPSIHS